MALAHADTKLRHVGACECVPEERRRNPRLRFISIGPGPLVTLLVLSGRDARDDARVLCHCAQETAIGKVN